MKTKILALIISILCLSMIFVACAEECEAHVDADNNGVCDNCEATVETQAEAETGSESESESEVATEAETMAPCDPHKDADADKKCDNCGGAVVTIIEYVTTAQGERVEMVVNTIPEASASEYLDTKVDYEFLSSSSSIKVKGARQQYLGTVWYVVITEVDEDEVETKTHQIIDISTVDIATGYFKVLWQGTDNKVEDKDGNSVDVKYAVSFGTQWFKVDETKTVVTVENGETTRETIPSHSVYTLAGDQIGKTWTYDEEEGLSYEAPVYAGYTNGLSYITYYGKSYAIDPETQALVYSEDTNTIVARPAMDEILGDFGYIFDGDNCYVYDLTKWIEKAYVYKAESRYEDVKYNVLQNGNVLMTAVARIPDNSVSFDYIEGNNKYDMIYIIIDPTAKTATPVEFGYMIKEIEPVGEEGFTAAAANLNVAVVYPVVDGYVNSNGEMYLLVDNDLKIACQVEEIGTLVADGIYLRTVTVGSQTLYELVDVDGNHIRYIQNYNNYAKHIEIDGDFYDYNYKLLVDRSEYISVTSYGSYYVLKEEIPAENEEDPATVKTYIYIPGKAPVEFVENTDETKHDWAVQFSYGYYTVHYTVTEKVDGEDVEVDVFELYAPDGSIFFSTKGERITGMNFADMIIITKDAEGNEVFNILQK